MHTLSLFIHFPFNQSTKDALDSITETGLFSLHSLPLDLDLVPLIIECRPCVCLLPLNPHGSNIEIYELLRHLKEERHKKGEPPRDPRLRIILVAEERGFQAESWVKLGVHEIVIAPVLPKALAYKLARHYYKATISPPLTIKPPEAMEEVEWTPHQTVWRSFLGKNSKYTSPFSSIEKTVISADVHKLNPQDGEWILDHEHEDFDEMWRWKTNRPSSEAIKTEWSFQGDKPAYNKEEKNWSFQGEKPKLWFNSGLKEGGVVFETDETKECVHVRMEKKVEIKSVKKMYYSAKIAHQNEIHAHQSNPKSNHDVDKMIEFLEGWSPKGATRLVENSGNVKHLTSHSRATSKTSGVIKIADAVGAPTVGVPKKSDESKNNDLKKRTPTEEKISQPIAAISKPIAPKPQYSINPKETDPHSVSSTKIEHESEQATTQHHPSKDQVNQTILQILFPQQYPKTEQLQGNLGAEEKQTSQKNLASNDTRLNETSLNNKISSDDEQKKSKNTSSLESEDLSNSSSNAIPDPTLENQTSSNPTKNSFKVIKKSILQFTSLLPTPVSKPVVSLFSKVKASLPFFRDKQETFKSKETPFNNHLKTGKAPGSTWSIQMEGFDFSKGLFKRKKPQPNTPNIAPSTLTISPPEKQTDSFLSASTSRNKDQQKLEKTTSWLVRLYRKVLKQFQ